MGVACVTMSISLRKGRYVGHLQWDSMRKGPTAWANLYVARVLGLRDTIYFRDEKTFTEIACPTRGRWFGKFMRGSKPWMGVLKNQYFGFNSEMVNTLLEV